MPDTRKLYALTFAKDHHGPTEILVNLPNGGRKTFNKFQEDDKRRDFPYAEMILEADVAEVSAAEFAGHGLLLKAIAKPRREEPSGASIIEPPPSGDAPVAVPGAPDDAPAPVLTVIDVPEAKAKKGRKE